jgi:hypothetical protein
MNRNKYGINFDEGIPFVSEWEFQNLYIPCHTSQDEEFKNWLDNGTTPILIGGQIGSGKSTFINKALLESNTQPDIIFHFDTEGDNLAEGDFIKVLLTDICRYALKKNVDLSFSNLPDEITKNKISSWSELIQKLVNIEFNLSYFDFKKDFSNSLQENSEYVFAVLKQILELIKNKLGRAIFILASGIDKFAPQSSGFISLQSSLGFLSTYRTIFEVNAVHIFNNKWLLKNLEKIFLEAFSEAETVELLKKRKGVYAQNNNYFFKSLAALSGGNPRQALRLLVNFDFYKIKKLSYEEVIQLAIKKTNQDLFAFSDEPSKELIAAILKDKSVSTSLFNLPGDKETANTAFYNNWFFITGHKEGNIWNAIINPIVNFFFKADITPEEYEMLSLKKYAEEHQISPTGLTYQVTDNYEKVQHELSKSIAEKYQLNLTETLDLLSDSLLSEHRQDRTIVVYKNVELMQAVKAYIFSKIFTYENPAIIDYQLNESESVTFQLMKILSQKKADIYSFHFENPIPDTQLIEVDKLRDSFLEYQLLWWIPTEYLSKYLQKWTQLRQLFQIIILEDEILSTLDVKQIQEDIDFYKEIKGLDNPLIKNLEVVLNYLLSND